MIFKDLEDAANNPIEELKKAIQNIPVDAEDVELVVPMNVFHQLITHPYLRDNVFNVNIVYRTALIVELVRTELLGVPIKGLQNASEATLTYTKGGNNVSIK